MDHKAREEGDVERAWACCGGPETRIRAECRLRDLEEAASRTRTSLRQLAQKAANNRLPTWYIDEIAQIADEITWTP
jgi:hypothetical protein